MLIPPHLPSAIDGSAAGLAGVGTIGDSARAAVDSETASAAAIGFIEDSFIVILHSGIRANAYVALIPPW
jgi:hypothetical protein